MGSLWRLYGGERAVRYSKPMVSLEYRCCDIIVDITIVIITNSNIYLHGLIFSIPNHHITNIINVYYIRHIEYH